MSTLNEVDSSSYIKPTSTSETEMGILFHCNAVINLLAKYKVCNVLGKLLISWLNPLPRERKRKTIHQVIKYLPKVKMC